MEKLQASIPFVADRWDEEHDRIKWEIRRAKHDLIEKLLDDSIHHGRYWLIRFDEYPPTSLDVDRAVWHDQMGIVYYRLALSVREVPHEHYRVPDFAEWQEPTFAIPADKTTDFIKYKVNQIKRKTKWRVQEWASKILTKK